MNIAVIIPAAGASRRLGRPKQLERLDSTGGLTLLRRAATAALEAKVGPVVVVLGAEITRSFAELRDLKCEITEAADWTEGISASIRTGVSRAAGLSGNCPGDEEVDAFMILLADQWKVTAEDIRRLAQSHVASGKSMSAASYDGTVGVPAVFGRKLLPELMLLKGDEGARKLLRGEGGEVNRVDMPSAAEDFDVPAGAVR